MENDGPQNAAEADAAARKGTVPFPDITPGAPAAPDATPAPTPAAAAAPADSTADAPAPAPAADPDQDDDAGTSPAAAAGKDPDVDDDDDDGELPEDVRKTWDGYTSEEARAKALHETKRHSNEQHERIKAQEAEIAALKAKATPPADAADRTPPADKAPAADRKPAPEPPAVQEHRSAVAALADAFDAKETEIKACVTELDTAEKALAKADSRIEFLEEEATTADEYRKDQITSQLETVRQERARAESKAETLRLRQQRLDNERLDMHAEYHDRKVVVSRFETQRQAADEANRKTTENFKEKEAEAKVAVQASITKAAEAHKIPQPLRAKFGVAMLTAANGQPDYIPDLDAFFTEQGRLYADAIAHGRAEGGGAYRVANLLDADQPAPEGAAAVAAPKKDRPLSSKDAHRVALAASRRVPLA